MKRILLIIDIQNDFLPGGALAVNNGNEIIPLVNKLQGKFELVIATKDWHPNNHKSFASQHKGKNSGEVICLNGQKQVLWPDHCVQNTFGAEFPAELNSAKIDKVFFKGIDINIDSYSAFWDNGKKRKTELEEYLRQRNKKDIYVVGLATDYCVKYTALDGKAAGFNVFVIENACKGVELNGGDIEKAMEEMKNAGIKIIDSKDIR